MKEGGKEKRREREKKGRKEGKKGVKHMLNAGESEDSDILWVKSNC